MNDDIKVLRKKVFEMEFCCRLLASSATGRGILFQNLLLLSAVCLQIFEKPVVVVQ